MPDSIRSFGELIDEAAIMTSRRARMVEKVRPASISTPTARLPSSTILRARPLTSLTFGRFKAGFR